MRVTFVLPGAGNLPVGGFKIVYEYANGLVRRGHTVCVVHPALLQKHSCLQDRGRALARYLLRRLPGNYHPRSWFHVDPRVRTRWVPSLHPRYVPDADAVVASAWQTAEWVGEYPQQKGERFYLIQHVETWSGAKERVMATWRLPLRKIVIARWLQELATSMGEHAEYIPNGLDFRAFGIDIAPAARRPATVLMLYHEAGWKGSSDGLAALFRVKERLPALEVALFGVPLAPSGLPGWIRYHRQPTQELLRALYNQSAVFVSPSRTEGWGLTASEALMCGCALAATDAGGHREFAFHEETALVSPTGQPDALAGNVERLVHDADLRIRLALAGHQAIRRFTWERAIAAFEHVLLSRQPAPGVTSPEALGSDRAGCDV
jgi:glycosyltransferase involved in cell wall biosynthesis